MGCMNGTCGLLMCKPGGITRILLGLLLVVWIMPAGLCARPDISESYRTPIITNASIAGNDMPGTTDYPNGAMTWMDTLVGNDDERWFSISLIDPEDGYGYFITNGSSMAKVIKVRMGAGSEPLERVSELQIYDRVIKSGVIDTLNNYLYLGTDDCKIIKVYSGEENEPPALVGETLISQSCEFSCGVIDPEAGFAYFGIESATEPGWIVKIALGQGSSLPYWVASLQLESGESNLKCAVIDPDAGYACFCTGTTPSMVVKVLLGEGSAAPLRHSALRLLGEEKAINCAVMDTSTGYAWLGLKGNFNVTAPRIVKIFAGDASDTMTRIGAIEPGTITDSLRTAVIDPGSGYAYFGMLIGAS